MQLQIPFVIIMSILYFIITIYQGCFFCGHIAIVKQKVFVINLVRMMVMATQCIANRVILCVLAIVPNIVYELCLNMFDSYQQFIICYGLSQVSTEVVCNILMYLTYFSKKLLAKY